MRGRGAAHYRTQNYYKSNLSFLRRLGDSISTSTDAMAVSQ